MALISALLDECVEDVGSAGKRSCRFCSDPVRELVADELHGEG